MRDLIKHKTEWLAVRLRGSAGRRLIRRLARVVGRHDRGGEYRFLMTLSDIVPLAPPPISTPLRIRLAWLIPEFQPGAGGHAAIFQLAAELSGMGFENRFWIMPGLWFSRPEDARRMIQERFTVQDCSVKFLDPSKLDEVEADVAIATEFRTAFYAVALKKVWQRLYLIQDYEPWFFARGSGHLLAEESYRLPLRPIVSSCWLAHHLRTFYGSEVPFFSYGVNHRVYFEGEVPPTSSLAVALYVREGTERRCVELGVLAMEEVARRLPGLHVHCFGQSNRIQAGFRSVEHGVLSPAKLGDLYRSVRVGVVLSATNHSLIPAEMMACGLPVVDLDTEATRMDFPDGVLARARAHPRALADTICLLLTDRMHWTRQRAAGLSFARELHWGRAASEIANLVRKACESSSGLTAQLSPRLPPPPRSEGDEYSASLGDGAVS